MIIETPLAGPTSTLYLDKEENFRDYMLTTRDNPYDPWTHWDEWYAFDQEKGYGTCEYLARIAMTSRDMSDEENDAEITRAIDEIIAMDFLDLYKRAYEPVTQHAS